MTVPHGKQTALISSLLSGAAFSHPGDNPKLIETHISWVILAGEFAYKIKKPVNLGFLDFSTLELRKHFCEEELRLNRRTAPEIYDGVVPVTRDAGGALALDGDGRPVEYLVSMKRFDQEQLLDRVVARDGLAPPMVLQLADRIAAFHKDAEIGAGSFARTADGTVRQIARRGQDIFDREDAELFAATLSARAEDRSRTE